jgi:hypothetical protein
MPKCCSGSCTCKLAAGTNVEVTGSGTPTDPFVISSELDFVVADNSTFNLTLTGDGTSASPLTLAVAFAATASINDLPDVNTTGADNGEVLSWNSATSRWEPVAPVTAPTGAVTHDDSLDGDGSVGAPLQVREDPARMLSTTAAGLGLTDTAIRQLVRVYADAAARAAASPAPVTNSLSMLATNPGLIDYWTGTAWAPVRSNVGVENINGQMLELVEAYNGHAVTVIHKQASFTTDGLGSFVLFEADELAGRNGVLSVQFQPTGALPFHATLTPAIDAIHGTAYKIDDGTAYLDQPLTGVASAWVY